MLAMSSAITKSWAKWLLADNLAHDFAMIGRMPVSEETAGFRACTAGKSSAANAREQGCNASWETAGFRACTTGKSSAAAS